MKNFAAVFTLICAASIAAIFGYTHFKGQTDGKLANTHLRGHIFDTKEITIGNPEHKPNAFLATIQPFISSLSDIGIDNGAIKRATAAQIVNYLQFAEDHGAPKPNLQAITDKIAAGENLTEADKNTLRQSIVEYGNFMNAGRINWNNVSGYWLMRPQKRDIGAEFDAALANHDLDKFLTSLTPQNDAYIALVGMRSFYANIAKNGDFVKIDTNTSSQNFKALHEGMSDKRIGQLRMRLAQENYNAPNIANPDFFDPELKKQLALYQEMHNIIPDGDLGEKTVASLNISAKQRLKQIDLNLERERWLTFKIPSTRIEVNITSQHLNYFDNGKLALDMPVVVGANNTKTPILADVVRGIVFNPPWYKPASIKGSVRVQPPGPNNALGRMKFDMENKHAIYLHDTPNHSIFSANERTFSHGCIRLHYPKNLAEILLKNQDFSREKIDKLTGTVKKQDIKTVGIRLKEKIPVFLIYRTAYVEPHDTKAYVKFTGDPYKWDNALSQLLYPEDVKKLVGKNYASPSKGAGTINASSPEKFDVAAGP